MLGMNWLKRRLKKKMEPVAPATARKTVQRLSMTYFIVGWNFVALLLYLVIKDRIPDGPDKVQNLVEALNLHNVEVVRVSGMKKVAEYSIDKTEEYWRKKYPDGKVRDMEPLVDEGWKRRFDEKFKDSFQ